MYLILCWSYLNHSLRFVGKKRGYKKKSHIKSQSQYFGKKSQLYYFPKSFSPNTHTHIQKHPRYNSSRALRTSTASQLFWIRVRSLEVILLIILLPFIFLFLLFLFRLVKGRGESDSCGR